MSCCPKSLGARGVVGEVRAVQWVQIEEGVHEIVADGESRGREF